MNEPPVRVGPDGPDPHPPKTGHARLDLVLALSAIFISGVSLFVAIEHGKTERDLVAANSWPFLRPATSNDYGPEHDLEFGVSNGGVGPAKVKTFEVFYQGAPVTDPHDLLRRCCGLSTDPVVMKHQINNAFVTSAVEDEVIRPGEDNIVFRLRKSAADPQVAQRFDQALRGFTQRGPLSFRACYCSVFDECWTTSLTSTDVTRVKVCPAPRVRFIPSGGR
ncbi:MAG TPA: hypothetical protein VGI30_07220 [Caulobacteraceae bacterium]